MRLHQRGKRLLVIDMPEHNTSSRIAAGIFNPITGRKMSKTWMAGELFRELHAFYPRAEKLTGKKFFYPMPLYRPFLSVEEQNEWMGKSSDTELAAFIECVFKKPAADGVDDPYGGLLLRQAGFLDTNAYVEAVRALVSAHHAYEQRRLSDDEIAFGSHAVRCASGTARHVVFCPGAHPAKFFNWLPIRALKGEMLEVETPLRHDWIINRGVYAVPGTASWRIGGTYNQHDHTAGITTSARIELEAGVRQLITAPVDVIGQQWGLRPTTPDRRPLLGRHPEHEQVWTLNGLGTKGVSLAPYFSEVLVSAIENGVSPDKVVDIERYKSLYWTSLT